MIPSASLPRFSVAKTSAAEPATERDRYRHVLIATFALAAAAGFVVGHPGGDARAWDVDLARLLAFMAVLKLGFALGAAALVRWRLGYAATPSLAIGYVGGVAAMALAPGLIWGLAHVMAGAVAFHLGLFALIVLAARDKAGRAVLL